MNKLYLKRYMNNKSNCKEDLKKECYKMNDYYIISDSYSIIRLNDNYNLDVKDDKYGLIGMFDKFENGFNLELTFSKIPEDNVNVYEPIDENFGINIKLFKRIQKVIKGNVFSIMRNLKTDDYIPFIIKLENNKTKEVAYMLPMRKF